MKISDFTLERYFARFEFKAPYLLCSSDCESFSIGELLAMEDGAREKMKELWLGYTETLGHPELRGEIARLYQTITPDDIIVFAGASEGIFILMNVLMEKDDNLIVQYPCYQSLFEVAGSLGCNVLRWLMREEQNWEPDINFLYDSINEKTRAIVINNPHNPTGYNMSPDRLREIIEIAREYQCIIFSDEVYRNLEYCDDSLPALCDCYENGVSLGVMSKSFGLAGLRIGWIACKDSELKRKIASFKDYTTICSSAPSEFLSLIALRHKDLILRRNLSIIRDNLSKLRPFFKKYRTLFRWVEPAAGPIAFPSLLNGSSIEEFCSRLEERKGVLLLPGTCYGIDDGHFRIGFGRRNMPVALSKLEDYINEELCTKA